MSTLKKFDNITRAQIAANGVQALADRPNSTGTYGVGGLSPADLKKWFDRLAELLAERINTMHSTLSAEDATKYIRVALDEQNVDSLYALIESFESGEFASKILKVYPSVSADELVTLQQAINALVTRAELKELVSELEATIKESTDIVEASNKLFRELEERLAADDIGSDTLKRHNESETAHTKLFGEGNAKGIKGYWIKNVADSGSEKSRYIVFHNTTVRAEATKPDTSGSPWKNPMFIPYEIGDEFSVITPKDHYHLCGKILGISEEMPVGTYSCWVQFYTDINWDAGDPVDNNDYSFFVPAKPDMGIVTVSEGSVAEGYKTRAGGDYSHSEGVQTNAVGSYSHAEGLRTWSGYSGHAEGSDTKAIGKYAHAEGFNTTAKGGSSHAEGENTEAIGFASHAEGRATKAIGTRSHSEGDSAIAEGDYSHAEGEGTKASGGTSHAEGCGTEASGVFAHTEGLGTKASAICSHAQGRSTEASGDYSFSSGLGTKATGEAQTALGKFNRINPNALLAVGNGENEDNRSSAFEIFSERIGGNNVVSMVLGEKEIASANLCQFASGAYVGTGAFGENNPTLINIGFTPKIIYITQSHLRQTALKELLVVVINGNIVHTSEKFYHRSTKTVEEGKYPLGYSGFPTFTYNITFSNGALSLWARSISYSQPYPDTNPDYIVEKESGAEDQYNTAGETYYYYAIG